jgi:hypothetical protein
MDKMRIKINKMFSMWHLSEAFRGCHLSVFWERRTRKARSFLVWQT